MSVTRRSVIMSGGQLALYRALAGVGLLKLACADAAADRAAFSTHGVEETLAALGVRSVSDSADVQIIATEIAENGQVVPVRIVSRLPNTQALYLLIERNPFALAAGFELFPGTEAAITTRVKMAETSDIHALIRAGDAFYKATKQIKVTLGGC